MKQGLICETGFGRVLGVIGYGYDPARVVPHGKTKTGAPCKIGDFCFGKKKLEILWKFGPGNDITLRNSGTHTCQFLHHLQNFPCRLAQCQFYRYECRQPRSADQVKSVTDAVAGVVAPALHLLFEFGEKGKLGQSKEAAAYEGEDGFGGGGGEAGKEICICKFPSNCWFFNSYCSWGWLF